MSDLMKEIVQAALRGGAGGIGGRQDPNGGNEPSRQHPVARSASAVPGISRPNYQRDRKELRLGAASGAVTSAAADSVAVAVMDAVPAAPASSASSLTRDFIEQSLAPLMRMALVQGNSREEGAAGCADSAASPDESGMLGRSCAGMDFWYYPELRPELLGELGIRRSSAKSAGIIAENRCRPGQLFLLDGCSAFSGVDVEMNWKIEGGRAFQAVLTGEAASDIRNALQCMYDQCGRNASRRIQSYIALEPSSILVKYLDIPRGEAVAALEGMPRYRSVALLDRALKLGMSSRVKFRIADEFIILTGEREELAGASTLLGKLTEPYA